MRISVIIPVGNETEWRTCEASLRASVSAANGAVEVEILPCFDLEHRGTSVARNEGLKRATGDWIAWVDCDDVVERSWLGEIAAAIKAHPEADVVQYDATEVKDGRERPLAYRYKGAVDGDAFARELVRNDGMPAWLWTRVFRRELFSEMSFSGRVCEDYQMFLQILPRIRQVWSIGKPLYRYIRHGHGLSNHIEAMDYAAAGGNFLSLIMKLPKRWRWDARIGLALTMADVALHSSVENGAREWARRYGLLVLADLKVPLRLKAKCLMAMMGMRRGRNAVEGSSLKIVHVCDGWEKWNGAANIARLIAGEQSAGGHEVSLRRFAQASELRSADEVWIHCGWKPCLWWAAFWAKRAIWMPEACSDPVRLNYHGWKKRLVGPIERWALRRCRKLVATCEAEKSWISDYLGKDCPEIVVENIKRFFKLDVPITFPRMNRGGRPLHLLYMGREHPLKGAEYLKLAVEDLKAEGRFPVGIELLVASNVFGEEKERVWEWADVLCLPTLSDNLGLVIAEALEHGRPVITTDGAPAWADLKPEQGIYLKGYRDGTDEERVRLLEEAITTLL